MFGLVVRLPLHTRNQGDGQQPLRDLDQIRGFLAGAGPAAFFDLPWMPLYLGICFLFHPWIGCAALAGAGLLLVGSPCSPTGSPARPPRAPSRSPDPQRAGRSRPAQRRSPARHGHGRAHDTLWREANAKYMAQPATRRGCGRRLGRGLEGVSHGAQSGVLALGAYLVIKQKPRPGIIIASSILTARALAPVELAIANWKGFVSARQSWARLKELLARCRPQEPPLALPTPRRPSRSRAWRRSRRGSKALVQDAASRCSAGSAVGVIGPSGSGKSSLVRLLVGVWTPTRGKVRLDGAALEQW